MIERIIHNGVLVSLIIRTTFTKPGISFFTPDDFSQQLAYMHHPDGTEIPQRA